MKQRNQDAKADVVARAELPTRFGRFTVAGIAGPGIDDEAAAIIHGKLTGKTTRGKAPLVRIHSQCLTGDVFHSLRCDCRQQLELALARITEEGTGILIYEQQEGRGIGLMAKLRAYELQDRGFDTVEANVELGYRPDCREFELPAAILRQRFLPRS